MQRTETIELTNMCMVYDGDRLLMQNRVKADWKGYAFPGGHVEPGEIITDSVIREIKEETGLDISNPKLCGIKEFRGDYGRYIVFLYKTNEFSGTLTSSEEGKVEWIKREDLDKYNLVSHFSELLSVFDDEKISEFYYDDEWNPILV